MGNSAGSVYLDLKLDRSPFDRSMAGLQSSVGGMAKKIGGTIAAGLSVAAFAAFSKSCLDLGSDLAEVQNVVDVAFPKMNNQINNFAKNAAAQFGLSETMAKRYVGTFGSMATSFGFTEKEAAKMSETLTGLAGDVASFYNISQDEAYTKLKSVFTGETETLKDLGIVMTQSALDQYALANGYGQTTNAMTEQEKVALRYNFVAQQLALAQGDFARTSDSWANQTRLLTLQFQSLKAELGQGLIAVLTPAIKALNVFIGKLVSAARTFKSFVSAVFGRKASSGANDLSANIGNVSTSATAATGTVNTLGNAVKTSGKSAKSAGKTYRTVRKLVGGIGGVSRTAKKATKSVKKASKELMSFDKINKLASKTEAAKAAKPTKVKKPKYKTVKVPVKGVGGIGGVGGIKAGGAGGGSIPVDGIKNYNKAAKKMADESFKLPKIFNNLKAALKRLGTAFSEFWGVIKSAGKWILKNVLKPLGEWTISKLAPALIDVLAGAFRVLSKVLKALAPVWKVLWKVFFKPLAKFSGKMIILALEGIAKGLNWIADFAEKHPKAFGRIVRAIVGFLVIKKVTNSLKTNATWLGNGLKAINAYRKGFVPLSSVFRAFFPRLTDFIIRMKNSAKATWIGIKATLRNIKAKAAERIALIKERLALIKSAIAEKAHAVASKISAGAQAALNAVMNANPILLVVVAIAALVAGFILAYKKSKRFRAIVQACWGKLKEFGAKMKEVFGGAVKRAITKIVKIVTALKAAWNAIKTKTATLRAKIKAGAHKAVEKLKGAWAAIKSKKPKLAFKIAKTVLKLLKKIVGFWIKLQTKKIKLAFKIAKTAWKLVKNLAGWWGSIKNKTVSLFASVKEKVGDAWDAINDQWDAFEDKSVTLWADAKEKTAGVFASLKEKWDVFENKTATLLADGVDKSNGMIDTIKTTWAGFENKERSLIGTAQNKLGSAWTTIQKAWDAFKPVKGKAPTRTGKLIATADDLIKSTKKKVWTGIQDRIKKFKDKTANLIQAAKSVLGKTKTWGKIKKRKKEFKDKTAHLIQSATNKLTKNNKTWRRIKSIRAGFKDKVAHLKLAAGKKIADTVTKIKNAWGAIVKGKHKTTLTMSFKNGLSSAWNALKKKVDKARKVGGKLIRPILPKMAALAQGGYVKKNTPQLAMIGDNRHEGEIVAPDRKLAAMAKQAAQYGARKGGAGGSDVVYMLGQILMALNNMNNDVYLDGALIAKNTVNRINKKTKSTGKCPVIV